MNLEGVIVNHNKFGKGIILNINDNNMVVRFTHGDKRFVYPDALERFLTIVDKSTASIMLNVIDKKKQQENEKRRRQEEERHSSTNSLAGQQSLLLRPNPNTNFMMRIKSDQLNQCQSVIEKRKINYLVHFTRLDNLSSILHHGIIPVSSQQKQKICSVHNDDQRIDSHFDCTSCSIEFPNHKLFFKFRKNVYPGSKWVVILLDKSLLISPVNITYYCYTNAARVIPHTSNSYELCYASALERMFAESVLTRDNKLIERSMLSITDNLPTDPQAEILISEVIDTKYIKRICFQTQNDLDEFYRRSAKEDLEQFEYKIAPMFFSPRIDYKYW